MKEQGQKSEQVRGSKAWLVGSVIPLCCIILILWTGLRERVDPGVAVIQEWAKTSPGASPVKFQSSYSDGDTSNAGAKVIVANPITWAVFLRDGGQVVYSMKGTGNVQAASAGTVVKGSGQVVQIEIDKEKSRIVLGGTWTYFGLAKISVREGERVQAGQVIGAIALNDPYPNEARLRFGLVRNDQAVYPPDALPSIFPPSEFGEGQRLYVAFCLGCHDTRQVGMVGQGKLLKSGLDATTANIKRVVRSPSRHKPHYSPAAISEEDLDLIAKFVADYSNSRF